MRAAVPPSSRTLRPHTHTHTHMHSAGSHTGAEDVVTLLQEGELTACPRRDGTPLKCQHKICPL
jgi:hypothetical protein